MSTNGRLIVPLVGFRFGPIHALQLGPGVGACPCASDASDGPPAPTGASEPPPRDTPSKRKVSFKEVPMERPAAQGPPPAPRTPTTHFGRLPAVCLVEFFYMIASILHHDLNLPVHKSTAPLDLSSTLGARPSSKISFLCGQRVKPILCY